MKTFDFVITTPDGNMFEGKIVKVSLRGTEGELAVMANHTPFVTSVKPCTCRIETEDGNVKELDIKSGILSVTLENVALITGNAKWM
ncbi:MAG: F0F1 ATP synthase subunit epsilon [Clostridia bacterium]|nr:F0F1 ATP synthase subunit epsilon [Clostridia bacterium]